MGLLLSSASMVAAHGWVTGAVVDGTYYPGYLAGNYSKTTDFPKNIGWTEKSSDGGPVTGKDFSNDDIICHKDATPGALSAEINAGAKVQLQWSSWAQDHHGPVITYLAKCDGDCTSVDKTSLEFFKIDEAGLLDDSNVPGIWATDSLIYTNKSWTVTIPSSIESGDYVLRHEIVALRKANVTDGAECYPQCLNLKIKNGGSDNPSGVKGTDLYKSNDPGMFVNIYSSLDSYKIPGPTMYSGASSTSVTAPPTTGTWAPTSTTTGSNHHATPTGKPSSSSYDEEYAAYLSSLTADQLLSTLRTTLTWLVSKDNKVQSRDFS